MRAKIQLKIIEFPDLFSIETTGNNLFIADDLGIYQIDGIHVERIYDIRKNPVFAVTDEGIWEIYNKKGEKKKTARLLNIFNRDDFSEKELADVNPGTVYMDKEICVFTTVSDDLATGYLKTIFLNSHKAHITEKFFGRFAFDDRLYALDRGKNLFCFDKELSKIWENSIPENLLPTYPSLAPQYVKPLVCGKNILVNAGVDLVSQDSGKILAFSKKDGNLNWEYDVQTLPSSIFVLNDKCYLAHAGDIIVIDGNTGQVVLKEPSGFDDFIMIYPFKDSLVCFSESEKKLIVFDIDANEVMQELKFPEGYYPSAEHGIIAKDDYLYACAFRIDSLMTSASRGLIVLYADHEKEASAEILPRVEMEVNIGKENGKKIYHITTDHDDPDEILRFGEIWLRETACKYGYEPYIENQNQDKDHEGKIIFSADLSKLPENTYDRLIYMANKLEILFKEIFLHPGAGKDYQYKIEIRPIK